MIKDNSYYKIENLTDNYFEIDVTDREIELLVTYLYERK